MKSCDDKCCLFHKDKTDCIIPEHRNFCYCADGEVISCINRIYNWKDLSKEGKERFIKFKNSRRI